MTIHYESPKVYKGIDYQIPHPIMQPCRCVLRGDVFTSTTARNQTTAHN